jgi:hypothetical protein
MRSMFRLLPGVRLVTASTLVSGSLLLLAAGWAAAAPPPPPKFWSVARCEQAVHVHDLIHNAEGHNFHAGETVCVGTGGSRDCKWTAGRRSRLYSQFTVFTRSRYVGSIIRSFTLTTRGGPGLYGVRNGGEQYAGWPAFFYYSPTSVRLLARNSTPASFRSIVAPTTARLAQQEKASGCRGG